MGRYNCVIFDLTDGCKYKKRYSKRIKYAAAKMGFKYLKEHDNDIIGPSLYDILQGFINFQMIGQKRLLIYTENIIEIKATWNTIYTRYKKLIIELKHSGMSIALATTKYKDFAELMLKNSEIYEYFSYVAGSNADGSLSGKKELLEYVMIKTGYPSSKCVMVGDRFYDAVGANEVGMDFIRAASDMAKMKNLLISK
jgi:phosphoglycolate phosphatase